MRIKVYIITCCLVFIAVQAVYAGMVNVSIGGQVGIAPELGGNLHSKRHEDIGVYNGVDGINRLKDGTDTKKVDRLLGASAGFRFNMIISDYYLLQAGAYYTMSVWGGSGKSLDNTANENQLKVSYSMWLVDVPLTVGLSIPFWYHARVSLSGGLALCYASMKNSLKSDEFDNSAQFKGFGYPLVLMLAGEYFITKDMVLTATFSYYKGATEVYRSGSDYAKIDLTGYRMYFGASYYFDYKIKIRKTDEEILEKL